MEIEVKNIELLTVGQNENELWRKARVGRITASLFYEVSLKAAPEKTNCTVSATATKILGEAKDISNLPAIQYGRLMEVSAKKAYENYENFDYENYEKKSSRSRNEIMWFVFETP